MIHSLIMENVGPAPSMELRFGSRLNLLTGDNGLGKSFLLDTIWWALTRKWPQELNSNLTSGYVARPRDHKKRASIGFFLDSKTTQVYYKSEYSPRDQAWTGKAGRPHNPGLVIYAQADGGFSVWDPARNYWKTRGKVDVQDRLPGFVFSAKEVWDGLQMTYEGRLVRVCKGLIDDWAGWIAAQGRESTNMNTVLDRLSPSRDSGDQLRSGPAVRISLNDNRDIPTIRTGEAGGVPILHASAGVKRVVQLAYMLLWTWEEHLRAANLLGEEPAGQVIVMIDEIECHLHPRWQRTVLGSLMEMMKSFHSSARIQLIAATHSPLVLASAEPFFDSNSDAWFDLDLDRKSGNVELRKRPFVRLGDVSNWLTSEAFDLKEPRSIEAERAIISALAIYREPTSVPDEIQKVDGQLRAVLGDTDPFLSGWSRFLREKLVAK